MCSARPPTASAASLTASFRLGCAWQIRATSSLLASNSIAVASSAMIVPASGPMMCAPRIRSVRVSARIFTNPSVAPIARARPFAANGNRPTAYSTPSARSCSSVHPIEATSGQV